MARDNKTKIIVEYQGVDKTSKATKSAKKNTDSFNESVKNASKSGKGLDGVLKGISAKSLLAGAGLSAAAVGAVKFISTWAASEKRMKNVGTLVEGNTQLLKQLTQGVREVAVSSSIPLAEFETELYNVASAMGASTDNLKVLEAAGKLATVGNGELSASVDVLTSTLNAFNISGERANEVAGVLFLAVKNGKLTIDELAPAMANVSATANLVGLEFHEVALAISLMTAKGISAVEAGTSLNALLIDVYRGTGNWNDALGLLNISMTEFRENLAGEDGLIYLHEILMELQEEHGLNLADLNLSQTALNALQILGSESGKELIKMYEELEEAEKRLEEENIRAMDSFEDLWGVLENQFAKTMLELGDQVVPAVKEALKDVIDFMNSEDAKEIIRWFGMIFGVTINWILIAINGLILALKTAAYGVYEVIRWVANQYNAVSKSFVGEAGRWIMQKIGITLPEQINLPDKSLEDFGGMGNVEAIKKANERASDIASGKQDHLAKVPRTAALEVKAKKEEIINKRKELFGGGKSGTTTTKQTDAEKYAEQAAAARGRAMAESKVDAMAKSGTLSGMGYDQRYNLAKQLADEQGLTSFSDVNSIMRKIESAGASYIRDRDRRADAALKALQQSSSGAAKTATRTPSRISTPSRTISTSGIVSAGGGGGYGGGGGGAGNVINIYVSGAVVGDRRALGEYISMVLTEYAKQTSKLPIGFSA